MWEKKKGYAARLNKEKGKINKKVEESVTIAESLSGM